MISGRWRSIEDIYHAALERPPAERADFLAEACDRDEDLRREVEELLRQSDDPVSILDHPVRRLLEQPELEAGQTLGPYRILGLIGAGGMGRVYKALDTRLGRPVAIKISRAGFTGRFRREAQAVAALNHPNICTLYDLGPNYLVMEYVEGDPLKGPMPLAQALDVAIAMAGALDAAHRRGVIHRDLKPANILLTESGPKLLDFGLAKLEGAPAPRVADSTTFASTMQATIAGTMHYMSPEQLQGRGADLRSDIFAFGAVFFELLTGRPAFDADNAASLIAAILTSHPRVRALVPDLPVEVERVIDRALAKDPEDRWQSARDLKAALELIAAPPQVRAGGAAQQPGGLDAGGRAGDGHRRAGVDSMGTRVQLRIGGAAQRAGGLGQLPTPVVRPEGEGPRNPRRSGRLFQSRHVARWPASRRLRARHHAAARHLGLRSRHRRPEPPDVRSGRRDQSGLVSRRF